MTKQTAKKTIAETHPHLLNEWHPSKNGELNPETITPGSGRKIWWICQEGHEWQTYVYSRAGKSASGCPECRKIKFRKLKAEYRPPLEKSLAHVNPLLASEWHPDKNERGPHEYTPGSNAKVWWKCREGHEWKTAISDRQKTGCPYCAGQKVSREKSFGAQKPELVKEWHPEKNKGKTPYDVMPYTHQKAWFLCENGHEWKAYIANRTKGKGCPYCSGHKPTDETSLYAVNPELCKEWNYEKNRDKDPKNYKPYSNEKVWWKCSKGHEWQAQISSRHDGRGCMECIKSSQTSFPEQAIYFYMKKVFPDVENRVKLPFLDNNSEADVFIPSLNLAIEYDGYHHRTEQKRDERKNKLMKENGIQLIRVRQKMKKLSLPTLEKFDSIEIVHEYESKTGLDKMITEIFTIIQKAFQIDVEKIQINANKDRGDILKQLNENERNLESLFPELALEWHPEKNGTLLPSQVSPFTHTKVWWRCLKNDKHEWESKVANRSNGRTCPYCLNRKINETNSLLTLAPEIGKEWHPTKNGDLGPHQVALNYSKKVWWICEVGHEWQETPNRRNFRQSGCPECRKKNKHT